MIFASLLESLLPIGISLLLLTTTTLGGGLLLTRLLKRHTDAATQTLLLRATFAATLVGILLAFAPLPHPDFKRIAIIASLKSESPEERNVSPALLAPVGSVPDVPVAATPISSPSPQPTFPMFLLLAFVWPVGTLLLLTRLLAGYGYIARLGKRAPVISPFSSKGGFYWKAFATAQRQPSKIVTVESADLFLVDLPFLPVFLALPQDVDIRFDHSALGAILAHERSHLERRDGWWNLAAQTLSCLLWFQPLIWFLMREMERNSEAASDESALVSSDCTARDYVEMLLRFAESSQRQQHPLIQSLRGITPLLNRSTLEERILLLMNRSSQPNALAASTRLHTIVFGSLALLTTVSAITFGVRSNASPLQPAKQDANPVTAVQQTPLISLRVVDASALDTLEEMLRQAGMHIAEGDEKALEGASRISMDVKTSPLSSTLTLFFRTAGTGDTWIYHTIEGKTLHLTAFPLDKNRLPLKRITLDYGPGPLRNALDEIFRGTGFEVNMREDIRLRKRVNLQNVPISEAIPTLLKSHPDQISWHVNRGSLLIQTAAEIQRGQEYSQMRTEQALASATPVTLNLQNSPLNQAIAEVLQAARVSYSIDNSVNGLVTISIKNKPIKEALSELLKQSQTPLQYFIQDGVVFVKRAP